MRIIPVSSVLYLDSKDLLPFNSGLDAKDIACPHFKGDVKVRIRTSEIVIYSDKGNYKVIKSKF